MSTYVIPQVLVFQEFVNLPSAIVDPLRAFIVGPHYHLVRYAKSAEKSLGSLGAYAPDGGDVIKSYPNRPSLAPVDTDFVRLHMDNAYLRYHQSLVASGGRFFVLDATTIYNDAINLASYTDPAGNSYPRNAAFKRDVRVGDAVRVWFGGDELWTTVLGLDHVQTASTVDTSPAEADSNAATAGSTTSSATALTNTISGSASTAITLNHGSYDGRPSGDIIETYHVRVLVAGGVGVGVLEVISASGRDDVGAVTISSTSAQPIGSRGLTANLTGSAVAGDRWTIQVSQQFTEPTVSATWLSSDDRYTGPTDTSYIVEVTTGGALGTAKVSVSTTTGIDSSGPHTVSATPSTPIVIGRYGVVFKVDGAAHGLRKGDKWYVDVTAKGKGAVRIIKLANNLPAGLVPSDEIYYDDEPVNVELFIKKNTEIPECIDGAITFEAHAEHIEIKGGIQAYDNDWAESNGTLLPLPVRRGDMYVTYRAFLKTYAETIQSLSSTDEVEETLGPADVDNPLALGVLKALTNSNGTAVKYAGLNSDDMEGYSHAIGLVTGRDDIYGIVPMTFDDEVLSMIAGHVNNMSSPTAGRWRTAWFGLREQTNKQIGGDFNGTITADTDPDEITIVGSTGSPNFVTNGVIAGDFIRTNYTTDACGEMSYAEYQIEAVINENTVRLVNGPEVAITVAQLMRVWRNMNKTQQAQTLADKAGAYGSRRVRAIWPDRVSNGGIEMPSYILAAALAGLRSGVVPHQGLTNVEIAGFDNVRRDYFNSEQMNIMAGSGVWIVTQGGDGGAIFTRHQVTTGDYDVVDQREDSVTTNVDAISYYFLNALKRFIGRTNVTPTALALLEAQMLSGIGYLKTNGFSPLLGGMLIDGTILEIAPHPTLSDRVKIRVQLTIPRPHNNTELELVI